MTAASAGGAEPESITFVRAECSLAKFATVIDGVVTRTDEPPWPTIVNFESVTVGGPEDLLDALSSAAVEKPAPCVVRAEPLSDVGRRAIYDDPVKGPAGMRTVPRAWVGYDCEKVPAGDIDPLRDPERAVAKIRTCLPPQHHDVTVVWQLTASAGKRADELRARLWFLVERPLFGRQVEAWCKPAAAVGWLDPATLRNEVIPHFIGICMLTREPDPCPQRWGLIRGERDTVPVPAYVAAAPQPRRRRDFKIEGGNLDELRRWYGPRLERRRQEAVGQIRDLIEETRNASKGARHPTYLRAAASIAGLCKYWCIPIDQPREILEQAYLETLTAEEARKRERGSVQGVWSWLDGRAA